MALLKQNVSIDFTGGLDVKSDEFTVIPGKLTKLRNMQFVDKNTINTRAGFDLESRVAADTYANEKPSTLRRFVTRRNGDVCAESKTGFHKLAKSETASRGRQIATSLNRCCAELQGVFHGSGACMESDVAGVETGYKVVIYSTSKGQDINNSQVWFALFHNNRMLRHERLDSSAQNYAWSPRVVYSSADNRFYMYFLSYDNNVGPVVSVRGTSFSTTAWDATLTITSIATDHFSNTGNLDACWQPYTSGGAVFLAYMQSGAIQVRCLKLSKSDGVTISSSVSSGALFGANMSSLRVVPTSLVASSRPGYIVVSRSTNSALGLNTLVADLDNGAPAAYNTTAVAPVPTGKIAVMTDPNNTTNFFAFWEEGTAGTGVTRIAGMSLRATTFSGGGTFTSTAGFANTTIRRGVGIQFDPFYVDRTVYIGAFHYSTLQAQHHALEVARTVAGASTARIPTDSNDCCARIGLNGGFLYNSTFGGVLVSNYKPENQISHCVLSATGKWLASILRGGGDRILHNGYDTTPLGVDTLLLDFTSQLNTVHVDDSTVMAGANPQLYDGDTLAELGFENYPEAAEMTATPGAPGVARTFQVCAIYEWVDANGQKHQSAPSVPVTFQDDGSAAPNVNCTVVVPTLRVTRKSNVNIAVFVTENGGSIFYRVFHTTVGIGSTPFGAPNNPNVDTLSCQFNVTTASITGGELLPTTGFPAGIAPMAYPACKHVELHQDRVVFCGGEDRTEIRYTEERQLGFFPWTNPTFSLQIGQEQGRCGSVKSMDDKLIVIQEKQIGAFLGRGPNRLGADNQFSSLIPVVFNTGQPWARSNVPVKDREGVWFFNGVGLRHINRGMQLSQNERGQDLGSEVDEATALNFVVGVSVNNKQQARFLMEYDGSNFFNMLVYDCVFHQWSKFDSPYDPIYGDAVFVDACFTDTFKMLDNVDDTVLSELKANTVDEFESGNQPINWEWETAFLHMGQVDGYQRVSKLILLGVAPGSQGLAVVVTTEIQPSTTESGSLGAQAAGYFRGEYQIERQKVSCLKLAAGGQGVWRISNVLLQVGVKKGTYKTATAQRMT